MSFLNETGLTTLWSKIKSLVSKCLPLTGGTITGNLELGTGTKPADFFVYNSAGVKFKLNIDRASKLDIFTVAD